MAIRGEQGECGILIQQMRARQKLTPSNATVTVSPVRKWAYKMAGQPTNVEKTTAGTTSALHDVFTLSLPLLFTSPWEFRVSPLIITDTRIAPYLIVMGLRRNSVFVVKKNHQSITDEER
ncbi:unnamed protein product [Caenorhabditis auriculariae]|uniref:Uncharacterized protein n=1 Tax=Caenorhabditis auriculariae TaxID=2777116 RepID=A0A8S1GR94_9PELO|nr:unnamed protein product [Caenorhabditis auriculariae]